MKKLVLFFLMAGGTAFSTMAFAEASSAAEQNALKYYFKAVDYFDMGSYKNAVNFIEMAEKSLTKTNARLSYLKAKVLYKDGELVAAQNACKEYFLSRPVQDAGYAEMTDISAKISAELDLEAQKRRDAINAQKEEAEKIAKQAELEEKANVERKKVAAEMRAKDVENQTLRNAEELKALQAAQKENTEAAYLKFIYDNPSSIYVSQAKSEMNKKWPVPTRVLRKNKYGYIDKSGDLVVKAKYDYASDFSEGRARVSKKGLYGFVDMSGKEIIPIKYKAASNFNYGYAAVKSGENEFFYVNRNGEKMDDLIYNDAKSFKEGLAAVQNDFYLYGFIDTLGNVVIPNEYYSVSWFSEGFNAVSKSENGKVSYGYIDKTGKNVTDFEFQEAGDFKDGVARVKKNGKYGLIDKFGNPVIDCEYDYISEFSNDGLALVKKSNYDLYVNRNGEIWAKAGGRLVKVDF